jgi:hypothetical protein
VLRNVEPTFGATDATAAHYPQNRRLRRQSFRKDDAESDTADIMSDIGELESLLEQMRTAAANMRERHGKKLTGADRACVDGRPRFCCKPRL